MDIISFNPTEDPRDIYSYRREKHFGSQMSIIDLDKGREIACVRFYQPDEVVYCVVWIFSDKPARGCGKAGGGGYHKRSAAMGPVGTYRRVRGRGDERCFAGTRPTHGRYPPIDHSRACVITFNVRWRRPWSRVVLAGTGGLGGPKRITARQTRLAYALPSPSSPCRMPGDTLVAR